MAEVAAQAPERRSYRWVAAPLLAFALVSPTAGLLAHHDPRSKGYFRLFFSDTLHMKAGFATAAAVLACFQLGFRNPSSRVLAHSLLGCSVYGAFASKVTIVRLHRFPRPVLAHLWRRRPGRAKPPTPGAQVPLERGMPA